MRADHDRPQDLQYFPVEFDRLIRVGAPVRSAVDWPERELVICDDPGLRAAVPQLDIKGQEEAKKGLN